MTPDVRFSQHAAHRVAQRVTLSEADLARMITQESMVDIGAEPAANRRHLLFFSIPDQAAFVLVWDYLYCAVITVLPLDYHQNLAWRVTEGQVRRAHELAQAFVATTPAPPIYTTALYRDDENRYKARRLFKWASWGHSPGIEVFSNKDYLSALSAALDETGLADRVTGFALRQSGRGQPVVVDMTEVLAVLS